jgi:hypothetical protein
MKSLSGSEANKLAILTLCLGNKKIETLALQKLDGEALKVAKKLINREYKCSKEISGIVDRLLEWKNSLGH